MTTKTLDSKGRLTLGSEFAGKTVRVHEEDDRLVVTFCAVVPEREAWLWENDTAYAMVDRGLREGNEGLLAAPDLDAAFAFADSIPDGDE